MPFPRTISDRLRTQHESIEALVSGLAKSHLNRSPAPGKWSIHDNIAHLACYQQMAIERLDTILRKDTPVFKRYRAEDDPAWEGWRAKDLGELLHTLGTDRQRMIERLMKLGDRELGRTGSHPKFGNMTILGWTEFFLLHEAHHIYTIFQLVHEH